MSLDDLIEKYEKHLDSLGKNLKKAAVHQLIDNIRYYIPQITLLHSILEDLYDLKERNSCV
jgi:hypothetical protein